VEHGSAVQGREEVQAVTNVSVLVVGGGPAGLSAALQARELGAEVTLLEAEELGGTSLNRGPAPVRTLARAARLVRDWSSWERFGLEGLPPVPNLHALLANSARVARYAHERKDVAGHLRRLGITLVEGLGPVSFGDPHTIFSRDDRSWSGDRIIIAVGGHAAALPVPGGDLAMTYEDIRSLQTLPERVGVIGAADTGCQLASIFADFGAKVLLFESAPAILPSADASISQGLRRGFELRGMEICTGATVDALESSHGGVVIKLHRPDGPEQVRAEVVFAAVGWPARVEELNLPAAGVSYERHAIEVDAYLRTSVEHIYAAGDVNGQSKVVQSARLEGRTAAWNAVRGPHRQIAHDVVPCGSFTNPEYGSVGLAENDAARHHNIAVGVATYDDLLRPVADGHPDGFCKLIADRANNRILGAHVLGEYSAETVQVVATAMSADMTVEQLAEMEFAFPTFTEGVSMAAQKVCRQIGTGQFPLTWSYLGSED
jgi:pyruvate/2-oxoglutarate dehydrogenase complex dihydrolipoamide dehydrogenase (E3) component